MLEEPLDQWLSHGGGMRKLSKVSELYREGKWNYSNVEYDGEKDEATISILCHGWKDWKKFKIKNYSKGEKEWKIIEDSDA